MITTTVSVTDKASPAMKQFIAGLTGAESEGLNKAGGAGAVDAAREYHATFDQSGGWRGKRYLGSGAEGSHFGSEVTVGWNLRAVTMGGATIANNATYYAFKVSGGTIRPKRKKYLTVPLIAEARGMMASVYSQNTGHKLFTIPGKSALFEQSGEGVRAVYALIRSVTMGPWPKAVPDNEVIADGFLKRWKPALAELINNT